MRNLIPPKIRSITLLLLLLQVFLVRSENDITFNFHPKNTTLTRVARATEECKCVGPEDCTEIQDGSGKFDER